MTLLNGAGKAVAANGWYLLNNAWNSGGLLSGIDYFISSTYAPGNIPNGSQLSWSYPAATSPWPLIRAYPGIMFGASPHGGGGVNAGDVDRVFPTQLADLTGFTADYSVRYDSANRGHNVAFDIWLTDTPGGDASHITNEIMIWLHKGGIAPYGAKVGTYSDANFTGTIYYSASSKYTAIVSDQDLSEGTIDIVAMLKKLQSLGIVSSQEYLADIEFGAEVVSGAGSLSIDDFRLNMEHAGPGGAVTSRTVTGAGVTNATVTGGNGDDVLVANAGDDIIDGSGGNDTASYVNARSAVRVDLSILGPQATGGSGTDQLINIQNLIGSAYGDTLKARDGVNSVLDGGAGNDTLVGGSGNDILIGGAGNDTLTGGAGDDIFYGGPGTNTIDGGTGIDRLKLSLESASYSVSRNANGSVTVSGGGETDILTGVEFIDFQDRALSLVAPVRPASDLNGDGASDVLWQTAGRYQIWSGAKAIVSGSVGAAPWTIAAVGDFNGDGTADLLTLQADNGRLGVWLRNGNKVVSTTGLLNAAGATVTTPGANWKLAGTGDFNADGNTDLLWQNDNGQMQVWTLGGNRLLSSKTVSDSPGAGWNLAGIGDFNGDRMSDLLWENGDGQLQTWTMNGAARTGGGAVQGLGASWNVKGVGDFDGDGISDIVFESDSGQVGIELMRSNGVAYAGAVLSNGRTANGPGADWNVAGTGDYNGDGRADILWQDSAGNAMAWTMSGNTLLSAVSLGGAGTGWTLPTV